MEQWTGSKLGKEYNKAVCCQPAYLTYMQRLSGRPSGKEPGCQCRRRGFNPWVGKIPWRRKRQPAPVFLPGNSHGQRSLAGHSPWGHKRLGHDLVTEQEQQTVHPAKCWAEWVTSWNQDCQEKCQQPQICRWYDSDCRKQRGTKKPLDEGERGEWKSWLESQH